MANKDDFGKLICKVKGTVSDDVKVGLFQKWPEYLYVYENGINRRFNGEDFFLHNDDIVDIFVEYSVFKEKLSTCITIVNQTDEMVRSMRFYENDFPGVIAKGKELLKNEWRFVKQENSQTVNWFLTCYAQMSILWGINPKRFGIPRHKNASYSDKKMLQDFWNVNDKKSLEHQCNLLYQGPYTLEIFKDPNSVDLSQKVYELKNDESQQHKVNEWTYDLFRLIMISNNGYKSGYFTKEETLDWCLKAGQFLQQFHNSWDKYYSSYLQGYEKWSGESVKDKNSDTYERKMIYKVIKNVPDSPWASTNWTTALRREW